MEFVEFIEFVELMEFLEFVELVGSRMYQFEGVFASPSPQPLFF